MLHKPVLTSVPAMRLLLITLLLAGVIPTAAAQTSLRPIGAPIPLTSGEMALMRPVWSPDGALIAASGPSYQGIWIMDRRGQNLRQINDEPAAGFGFEWSPDGQAIVARVARFEGARRLNAVKIIYLKQQETRQLTEYRPRMAALPHWAPAGDRVFLYEQGALEITDAGLAPDAASKSSENAQVFFAQGQTIGTARMDDVQAQTIRAFENGEVLNLVVSPDRSKVAFEILGGNMYVIDRDGSNLLDLGKGYRPQWSPDSRWVVCMKTRDDGYQFTEADLWAVRASDGLPVQLTDTPERMEMNPFWSPDGRHIVFDELNSGILYALEVAE